MHPRLEDFWRRGLRVLTEEPARWLLAEAGIPIVPSERVENPEQAVAAAERFGYPVVLKGCGAGLIHKTEHNLIHLQLRSAADVRAAFLALRPGSDRSVAAALVQPQLPTDREFVAGLVRDPQFGPCVMFGLGGIFTESLRDVVFRVAPIEPADAQEMLDEIRASALLGAVRGKPAVDRVALGDLLVRLGALGLGEPRVGEVDLNPLLIDGCRPVAVDALVVLRQLAPETKVLIRRAQHR